MTSRNSGRHRAPASEKTTATAFTLPQIPRPHLPGGAARPVAKAGAVIAVSGGLVASLGMQANAAPITAAPMASSASTVSSHPVSSSPVSSSTVSSSTVSSTTVSTLASGLVAAPQSPQVGAGQFGEIGFTAKAKPKPKPPAMARASRPFSQRSSRSATRSSVSATDATTSTDQGSTDQGSTDQATAPVDSAPATIKAGAAGSSEFGASVLAIAARYDGIDYRYGGTTPAGFDCSGYTAYVLAQVGVDLPRTSGSQRAGTTRISRSEAVAGDLVFMPGHVGIYAGNGMMWDSPRSGKDVSKRPVYSSSATFGRVG